MLRYLSADIYLFREANSFPRPKLEENCELRGADNAQGQISEHILKSNGGYCVYYPSNIFRNMRESRGNRQNLPFCHMSITSKFSVGFQNLHVRFRFRSKAFVWGKGKTFERKVNLFNSVKDKSKIQVADKVTGYLTTSREQAKDH